MSLYIDDDPLPGVVSRDTFVGRDYYLPSSIHVYGNVKPQAAPLDCRNCVWAGMASCNLQAAQCVGGSEFKAAVPVQFWGRA